jgi:esterase/lipase superfamily enzyme
MSHRTVTLGAEWLGGACDVLVYGHWGRPLLAFPSESGSAYDYEANGMIGAIGGLIEAGRVKVYCVPSFDEGSWRRHDLPLEDRARLHGGYERWILERVCPFVDDDCGGFQNVAVTGSSFGAYHAANFALRHADRFGLALCLSGVYDLGTLPGNPGRGDEVYFQNPMDYVPNLHGEHLDWLRANVALLLVCGQGQWEDTTGALDSTRRFAGLLAGKGIRHELDLWGHDVPHDWSSWRRQIAHHLPRFV